MVSSTPPSADDHDAYIFVDHREWLPNIVEGVSRRLAAEHELIAHEHGPPAVTFRGEQHRIPLTMSAHDQYVVISSLAELLKDHYRVFVLAPSLDTDTHGLLVVPTAIAKAWDPMPAHLTPLQLGFDYFHQIKIPYLNHEDSAPDFARDSERLREAGAAWGKLIEASLLHRTIDSGTAGALTKLAMQDAKLKTELGLAADASEADVAAKIQAELNAALQAVEAEGAFSEFDNAMQELWALTGGPPPEFKKR